MTTFQHIIVDNDTNCGTPDGIFMGTVNTFEGVAKYSCEEGYKLSGRVGHRFK